MTNNAHTEGGVDPRLVALYDADNPAGPDHAWFRGVADEIVRSATAGRTISAANVAPPPTPATPKELTAITSISVSKKSGASGFTPTVGATITASMAG